MMPNFDFLFCVDILLFLLSCLQNFTRSYYNTSMIIYPLFNVYSSEMPRYIDHIWGHSAKTGRMYFRDSSGVALLSSLDCKHFELTDEDEDVTNCPDINQPYCADDIEEAVNVPGKSEIGFEEQTFPNSNIKGNVILTLRSNTTIF